MAQNKGHTTMSFLWPNTVGPTQHERMPKQYNIDLQGDIKSYGAGAKVLVSSVPWNGVQQSFKYFKMLATTTFGPWAV